MYLWDVLVRRLAAGRSDQSLIVSGLRGVGKTVLLLQFFHVRFEKATPAERRYMSAIAALGDGPQNTGEVASKMSYKSRSSGSLHRDALIKKGLIYSPEHGTVDFTVPHFAAFMRRRYPLDE